MRPILGQKLEVEFVFLEFHQCFLTVASQRLISSVQSSLLGIIDSNSLQRAVRGGSLLPWTMDRTLFFSLIIEAISGN